jgi:hypothetical protein
MRNAWVVLMQDTLRVLSEVRDEVEEYLRNGAAMLSDIATAWIY